MNEITTEKKASAMMLAHREKSRANSLNAALQEGVMDSFPTVSFRSGVWRVKFQGQEKIVTGPNGKPATELRVVILAASRHITKQWYEKAFDPNAALRPPPDCASIDGVKPDAGVPKPQSPTCASCHNNVFGSAKPRDGVASRGKACQDRRRIAVMIPPQILGELKAALLTIPPTSLKNLRDYSKKLDGMGLEANMVATTLGFDPNAKQGGQVITFEDDFVLPDREFEMILKLATDETIDRMLRAPIDAVNADPLDEDLQARATETKYASFTEPVPTSEARSEAIRETLQRDQEPAPVTHSEDEDEDEPVIVHTLADGSRVTADGEILPPATTKAGPDRTGWVAIKNQPGVYFSPQAGGMVNEDGTEWVAGKSTTQRQSPTKSEPEIIPPGQPIPGSFMGGGDPEEGQGEALKKPAEPAPGSAGAKRRGRPSKTAAAEESQPAAVSETETKAHTPVGNGNGTEQTVSKAGDKVLDVLSGLFPGS